MKKYFLTMATIAFFAIGFAASDEEESSNNSSNSSSTIQTEQKQESEAERQARERKEKIEQVKQYGYECGKRESDKTYPTEAKKWYKGRWGLPETDEDLELFKIFSQEYDRGLEEGREALRKMDNL